MKFLKKYLKVLKKYLAWSTAFGLLTVVVLGGLLYLKYKPLTTPELIDQDADGYTQDVDCNDQDPTIYPTAVDFPGDDIDQDCKDGPAQFDTGGLSGEIVSLYEGFIFSGPITPDRIRDNSRKIRVTGEIAAAILRVEASASEFNGDLNRQHTVYFYIDTGDQGGHIDLAYSGGDIISGTFREVDGDAPQLSQQYDLSNLPLGQLNSGQNSRSFNVLEALNQDEEHFIGAFVASGIYGQLDRMTIEYSCVRGSDCSIELVK